MARGIAGATRLASFFVSLTLLTAPLGAQAPDPGDVPEITRLLPPSDYLDRPEDERVPAYPFIRCGGLFLGYLYYAGATFDDATRARTDETIANLRTIGITYSVLRASEQRGETGADFDPDEVRQISQDVWRQMNGIAFFYDDRMEANFVEDGTAFAEDPLISTDLALCNGFAQTAAEAANEARR